MVGGGCGDCGVLRYEPEPRKSCSEFMIGLQSVDCTELDGSLNAL